MWKLLGAVMLIGGGGWLGLEAAGKLARRAAGLEAWAHVLALLEGELAFRLPAMPELLKDLSQQAKSPAREALAAAEKAMDRLGERSFGELWAQALRENSGDLDAGDLEVLYRLGDQLGRWSWEDQRKAANLARQALSARAAQTREDLRRKGKSYGTLGLALGAFVTILLL